MNPNEASPPPKRLINRIFKPVLIICSIIIILCYGTLFFINSQKRATQREAKAWDRLAIATATVALDQYSPDTDYGPIDATGWTVIHNQDGTTTVWAPQVYGRIAIMLTDDGENYTPYYISVDGTVKLGVFDSDPPTPSPSATVATTASPSIDPATETAKEVLLDYYTEDEIGKVSSSGSNLQVIVKYPGVCGDSAPEDWEEKSQAALDASAALTDGLAGDSFSNISIQLVDDESTILANIVNGKTVFSAYATYDYRGDNPPTISLEEFNAIKNGMTYQEVFDIVGSSGTILSESDLGLGDEYFTRMYMWEGEGSLGANANVTFQGGKVIQKAQFGLE